VSLMVYGPGGYKFGDSVIPLHWKF